MWEMGRGGVLVPNACFGTSGDNWQVATSPQSMATCFITETSIFEKDGIN